MRTSTIRSSIIAAVVGLGFAAVGSARADNNSESACVATTLAGPGTVAAAPGTVAAAPVTVEAAPATPDATGDAPGALPAAATVQQLQALMVPVIGPTTDILGELAPLGVTPPTGVPTPEGSDIDNFDIWYYPDAESPHRSYYNAKIVFTASVPAADMVAMYQTQLVAAGYVQTADAVENDGSRQERFLTYDIPNSTFDRAEIRVAIIDGDTDFAQLDIYDALDPAIADAFSAWPTGLPLVDQTTSIDGAHLSLDHFGSDYVARVGTDWVLPMPSTDARDALLAALPDTPYSEDPDLEASETSVYLVGGEFDSLDVRINDGYPEGTSYFNVNGEFDVQL